MMVDLGSTLIRQNDEIEGVVYSRGCKFRFTAELSAIMQKKLSEGRSIKQFLNITIT